MGGMIDQGRITLIKSAGRTAGGPVVYWMSRDQRAADNWALLWAQDLASRSRQPLIAVFCLVPSFLGATLRQYDFMLRGLAGVEDSLRAKNIGFCLLTGAPDLAIPRFLRQVRASTLVSDFDPLKIKRRWQDLVAEKIGADFYQVDAHNIVPCRQASPKQEFAARTFRPKVEKLLCRYLTEFPELKAQPFGRADKFPKTDWRQVRSGLIADAAVGPVAWLEPGEEAARRVLKNFIDDKLARYDQGRNDPLKDLTSDLSPYLHFGQLSAQRVALVVQTARAPALAKGAFLEELIVRRELSDNFCFYNRRYDVLAGSPAWARQTLAEHGRDRRLYLYGRGQLEVGRTHDRLWNAAQKQLVLTGKMPGYLRMYWAKKILEWSATPAAAVRTAVYLNDKYELDGRDPNGYVGILWSIGGLHDRPWGERPVFGKVRYMSYNGARSKFDVANLVARWAEEAKQ